MFSARRSRRWYSELVRQVGGHSGTGHLSGFVSSNRPSACRTSASVVAVTSRAAIARDLGRIMGVVGQRLGVGHQNELMVIALQRDAIAQRADIMAEVKRPGGAITGENGWTNRHDGRLSWREPPYRSLRGYQPCQPIRRQYRSMKDDKPLLMRSATTRSRAGSERMSFELYRWSAR